MRRPRLVALLFSLLLGLAPVSAGLAREAQDFGAVIDLEEETPLAEAARKAEELGDRPVLVRGRVADVCRRKGCWTILRDGDSEVRVRFKDYAFFVPTDCQGREALVQGVIEVRTLSPEMARHYDEESRGAPNDAPGGERREITMVATGVRLLP